MFVAVTTCRLLDRLDNYLIDRSRSALLHGIRDARLELHRELLNTYCDKGTASIVEWDCDHHLPIPIKSEDVDSIRCGEDGVSGDTGVHTGPLT